jgi:hypothetical protein
MAKPLNAALQRALQVIRVRLDAFHPLGTEHRLQAAGVAVHGRGREEEAQRPEFSPPVSSFFAS